MGIAALVLWILTAGGGFYMFARWIRGGGHRRDSRGFPPALIYGHLLLAAAGLVLWIIYLAVDNDPLGWAALIVLAPVALLGFTMLARWIPLYRNAGAQATAGSSGSAVNQTGAVPERSFPPVVVATWCVGGGHRGARPVDHAQPGRWCQLTPQK
jgi:manganese efflux pump family protein